MSEHNTILDAADAIKGVAEAVPVYQDVVQPAAKEVGSALQTVARTLHVLLAPVSALVWGYEKISVYVSERVAEKLKDVPSERLRAPEPNIAGPALEALRYTGYLDELREMYAKLLATSIDSATAAQAHPSFVEIIKQLSPDEARLLAYLATRYSVPMIDLRREEKNSSSGHWVVRNFTLLPYEANCLAPAMGPNYLENLQRLGIVELREDYRLIGDSGVDLYEPLFVHPAIEAERMRIESDNTLKAKIGRNAVILTKFGAQFCAACVAESTHSR